MSRIPLPGILVLALVLAAPGAGLLAQDEGNATRPTATRPAEPLALERVLDVVRERHGLPALAAAVIDGGELAALGATGVRKLGAADPVTREDRFHLGSDTKAMTATLIAVLVEDGKLTWDARVGDVLAEAAPDADAGWKEVTIEQLLRHRGGAPADTAPKGVTLAAMKRWEGSPAEKRRRYARAIMARPPAFPGERTVYSNAGYVLAGAMAEAVTKTSWEDLLRTRVFAPLGMTSAGFGPPGAADAITEPWPHLRTEDGLVPVAPGPDADNPDVIGPAGTVHASLRDWARFVGAHLDGGEKKGALLEKASFARLHAPSPAGSPFACGWIAVERPWARGRALTHAGSNTLNFAVVWAAPERDFAVLICTNAAGDPAEAACDEVAGEMIRLWSLPADERRRALAGG